MLNRLAKIITWGSPAENSPESTYTFTKSGAKALRISDSRIMLTVNRINTALRMINPTTAKEILPNFARRALCRMLVYELNHSAIGRVWDYEILMDLLKGVSEYDEEFYDYVENFYGNIVDNLEYVGVIKVVDHLKDIFFIDYTRIFELTGIEIIPGK